MEIWFVQSFGLVACQADNTDQTKPRPKSQQARLDKPTSQVGRLERCLRVLMTCKARIDKLCSEKNKVGGQEL